MPKPKRPDLKRRRVPRSRFFELDGAVYYISDRDADGLEAVRLDDADAAVVRRMRDENEIETESALLSMRK